MKPIKQIDESIKKISRGEYIYNDFCKRVSEEMVSTPSTFTLEMFTILEEKKEYQLLIRELMKEYIKNLPSDEIRLKNGKVYIIEDKYIKL